jgi:multiple sugar transport system substrate-binding protein
MVKAGNVHPGDRTENGETFHLPVRFGQGRHDGDRATSTSPWPGQQNPEDGLRHRPAPGDAAGSSASFIGGDLVVVPKAASGSDDAVNVHEVPALRRGPGRGLRQGLNLTTRSDMVDNKYFQAEPLVQDVAKALTSAAPPTP